MVDGNPDIHILHLCSQFLSASYILRWSMYFHCKSSEVFLHKVHTGVPNFPPSELYIRNEQSNEKRPCAHMNPFEKYMFNVRFVYEYLSILLTEIFTVVDSTDMNEYNPGDMATPLSDTMGTSSSWCRSNCG